MSTKHPAVWIAICGVALLAELGAVRAQTGGSTDTVAAITKIENDAVKADLANDKAFYEKYFAEDWTGGDSGGKFYTKADVLKMADDPKNNKTNSEKISDLKVRVYGNTAIATYKDTYDALMMGEHRATTVISTDAFVKTGGTWKMVASHASVAK